MSAGKPNRKAKMGLRMYMDLQKFKPYERLCHTINRKAELAWDLLGNLNL